MKLGYNEACAMKKSTLGHDLVLCEKYGYDYIEIRLDMLKVYLENNTIEDLQNFFKHSHLKPFAFNSIEDVNFCSETQWKDRVELFTFACEAAQKINNPYIIVVPTMSDEMKNKSEKEVFDDSVKVLHLLAEIAKPYGIKIAFEPIGDIRWCVRSLSQCWNIIKAVDRDDVGIALDGINMFLYNRLENINDIDLIPIEKIFVYHIDDCENLPLGVLDHCHRLFPGEGVIPLEEISKKLKAKGYIEIASMELFRPEYWEMDPEEVIRIGAEKVRKFL